MDRSGPRPGQIGPGVARHVGDGGGDGSAPGIGFDVALGFVVSALQTPDADVRTGERSIPQRVDALDWGSVRHGLDDLGIVAAGPVLNDAECGALVASYGDDARFRSTVEMGRHRYGEGQYRYFAHPLPETVDALRHAFWPHLLTVAREWSARRQLVAPWPDELDEWLEHCHAAGQTRPTPLMLRYGPGGWNALHRDLYGELVFPLQVVIGLDAPDEDYTGGELVVVEQRPRAQSRATALRIPKGHAVAFTTRDRPVRSARGWTNAPMRHGVSVVHSGRRHTLGLIFHDAA